MLFTAKMIFFKSLLTGAVVITNQAVHGCRQPRRVSYCPAFGMKGGASSGAVAPEMNMLNGRRLVDRVT